MVRPFIPFKVQELLDKHGVILTETGSPFTEQQLKEITEFFNEHPNITKIKKTTTPRSAWDDTSSSSDSLTTPDSNSAPVPQPETLHAKAKDAPLLLKDYDEDDEEEKIPAPPQSGLAARRNFRPNLLPTDDEPETDEEQEETPRAIPAPTQTGFKSHRLTAPPTLSLTQNEDEEEEPSTSPDISSDASVGDYSGSEESKTEGFKTPYSIFKMKDGKDRDKFIIVYPIKLGKGKFGTVKLAQELILTTKEDGIEQLIAGDIIVVKKSLRKINSGEGRVDKGAEEEHTFLFKTEKEATQHLFRLHGHLTRDIQDKFEYNGKFYLAMDFIEGSSLADFIISPNFNEKQKLQALLAALKEYQSNTEANYFVAHGDFHIGNILIGSNPEETNPENTQLTAEIIDLSFAKLEPKPSDLDKSIRQQQDIIKLGHSILKYCSENDLHLPKLVSIAKQMVNQNGDTHNDPTTMIVLIDKEISSLTPPKMPTPLSTKKPEKTQKQPSIRKLQPLSPPPSSPPLSPRKKNSRGSF